MIKKSLICGLLLTTAAWSGLAQNVGDQDSAGYASSRDYFNSNQGDFSPPLELTRTIMLDGVTSADSLLAFSNGGQMRLLVGDSAAGNASYRLFDADTGVQLWTFPLPGFSGTLNYTPAYSNDVLLLGGAATTGVAAVRASTGTVLWNDPSVGATAGRFPVLSNGLALYAGRSAVTATDPVAGPSVTFWRRSTTTAQAPLSVFGDRAYFLEESGTLRAVGVRDGIEAWNLAGVPAVNPNYIATNGRLFVNSSTNQFGALNTADGGVIWAQVALGLSETPATALAYGRLYAFSDSDGSVAALDANTGNELWRASEDGPGIDFGLVADNVVYYYHASTQRLRARDAFTGNLLWSRRIEDVRRLSAADGRLFVLLADRVEVFEPVHAIYFAQIADGGGQRTLVTLNNPNPAAIAGTLVFFDDNGDPLTLDVDGFGAVSNVPFTIPAGLTLGIRTLGTSTVPTSGWALAAADGRLSGSSIFEFGDDGEMTLAEAGVADSAATGSGNVFVEVALPPVRAAALSTGVAVANVSDEDTVVGFTLVNAAGATVATLMVNLPSRAHFATFVEQLFPSGVLTDFEGSLLIESDLPLAVTALRTQSGVQLSSYSVGR